MASRTHGRYWVLSEYALLRALRSVADGTHPDVALMELVANSGVEDVPPDPTPDAAAG